MTLGTNTQGGELSSIPHILPYQGSKRKLAERILSLAPSHRHRLIEPFAGSAAVTVHAAYRNLAEHYVIGEVLKPLADLWQLVVADPDRLSAGYRKIWEKEGDLYLEVRNEFNRSADPVLFLYLMARCVKAAIRFNSEGQFNQSADKRRRGMHPDRMSQNIHAVSSILSGKTTVRCSDYADLLDDAGPSDLVYLDPPWQGTSTRRDTRYALTLELGRLINDLDKLNCRGVPFLLSFDGRCGDRRYGEDLPSELGLRRLDLYAGRSTQSTLAGRDEHTIESLYVSQAIVRSFPAEVLERFSQRPGQATMAFGGEG